jgi:hypothetical protein
VVQVDEVIVVAAFLKVGEVPEIVFEVAVAGRDVGLSGAVHGHIRLPLPVRG